ncbi:short-chain collagen C4-like [Mya arenaria]|uniref:short-chain collagen C4-like n=1 Tax=Mya arenaria TaxID=6604 RepID=UPI0022E2A612|nr:short-chain collagen C4-like [Mya arenaria]
MIYQARGILSLILLINYLEKAYVNADEPACSKFDFEERLLAKVIKLEHTLKTTQETVESIKASAKRTGTTYIRWGRTECNTNGTELVYRGFAGGSFYTDNGGASNYLCLPEKPEWGNYDDKENGDSALVYGGEFQLNNRESFFDHADVGNIYQQDVPCAVCKTERSSLMMIPAKRNCFDGWTKEYEGYLAAGSIATTAPSEYVCLDGKPEILYGGGTNTNGKLFYIAEARCGSLRCPPYVNGRELTCAVCTA